MPLDTPIAKGDLRRRVEVNMHDTSLGIWQDDARDPTFQREIYGGLLVLC